MRAPPHGADDPDLIGVWVGGTLVINAGGGGYRARWPRGPLMFRGGVPICLRYKRTDFRGKKQKKKKKKKQKLTNFIPRRRKKKKKLNKLHPKKKKKKKKEEVEEEVDQLHPPMFHLRSAERILKLCEANKGFYVKAGQFVAALRQVPKAYSSILSSLQDQVGVTNLIAP
ncbi:hypothetical protein TIFTF001_053403 [Ficus carica]|uniref:Uncharacterized protein n=1 Tax=Ficus carica TaxID=3494 RepID=A0AA88EB50_FICCA|nr:hypothetical protein TIFTF001_053403 [Ficus carica]